MKDVVVIWSQLAACAALIAVAGTKLSRYADVIADKTGLSGNWIGLILLATVTSLPELATGISSVTIADAPDIAVGDVLGSCVFNLAILVVLDFLHRGESVYRRANQGHILSAGFGIILIGFAGLNLLLADKAAMLAVGHIGASTPVILIIYVIAMRTVFIYERDQTREFVERIADPYPLLTLRRAAVGYAAAAAVIVAAGTWLPFIGVKLSTVMGWHKTFVGTLFIAAATSLPELAVTVAALRIGALDMAIGNLLGSNLFNILILTLDDLFFLKGPPARPGLCAARNVVAFGRGDDRHRHRRFGLSSAHASFRNSRLDQPRTGDGVSAQLSRAVSLRRVVGESLRPHAFGGTESGAWVRQPSW